MAEALLPIHWVSVEERLPPNEDLRLVVYESPPRGGRGWRRSVQPARYAGGAWRFIAGASRKTRISERVSWWMSIPPMPELLVPCHVAADNSEEQLSALVNSLDKRCAELEREVERLTPRPLKMGYAGFSHCGCWQTGTYGEDNHIEYKCPAHADPVPNSSDNLTKQAESK